MRVISTRAGVLAAVWALALTAPAAPSAAAGEAPPSPFGPAKVEREDAVPGRLVLSDGTELTGRLYLTRDKRLEVFDAGRQKWFKLKLKEIASIGFAVESQTEEKEWRWKENASDVKVYTGRFYIDRKYTATVKLTSGEVLSGHVRGTVIYVEDEKGRRHRYFLRTHQRGEWGQTAGEIVYVREVVLGEPAAGEGEGASEGKAAPDG